MSRLPTSVGPEAEVTPYPINPEQRAHFETHGFVVLPDVLTAREIAEIRDRVDGILQGWFPVDRSAFIIGAASNGDPDDLGRFTQQVMATRYPIQDEVLAAYGDHPRLRSLAAQLMETSHAGIFQQQALIKPPRQQNPTPWHQDDYYFGTEEPAITAWIALEPVSESNGTLRVVPGSHKAHVFEHASAAGGSAFKEVQAPVAATDSVPILPKLGDVSFHHKRTLHGAFANNSDARRIAIAQHYCGGNVELMRSRWIEHIKTQN